MVPVTHFFAIPNLRKRMCLVVYGPQYLFRSAWIAGAQEYLKEPWEPEELFLRLEGPRPPFVEWKTQGCTLRLEELTVTREGGPKVALSSAEAEFLRVLVQRRGVAVSRPVLGWAASCSSGRVVDTLVARLRRKIQELLGCDEDPIPSVRGLGYRLP